MISKKSSPLKPLCQMNRNFRGNSVLEIDQKETRIAYDGHDC
jgi:hypothetical protein